MVDITEVLAIVMTFSIPLSIIGGVIYIRAQKLKAQTLSTEERQVLLQLKHENAALRDRLDSVETIVAEIDSTMLLGASKPPVDDPAKRIEALRQKLGS